MKYKWMHYEPQRPSDKMEEVLNKGKQSRVSIMIPVSKIINWFKKRRIKT